MAKDVATVEERSLTLWVAICFTKGGQKGDQVYGHDYYYRDGGVFGQYPRNYPKKSKRKKIFIYEWWIFESIF